MENDRTTEIDRHILELYDLFGPEEIADQLDLPIDVVSRVIEDYHDRMEEPEYEDFMDDVDADADVLRMCGWGTDEDYGYYGDDF